MPGEVARSHLQARVSPRPCDTEPADRHPVTMGWNCRIILGSKAWHVSRRVSLSRDVSIRAINPIYLGTVYLHQYQYHYSCDIDTFLDIRIPHNCFITFSFIKPTSLSIPYPSPAKGAPLPPRGGAARPWRRPSRHGPNESWQVGLMRAAASRNERNS